MASAGAQCDHVNHVSTQLPYAITCAAVSCVSYIVAGFVPNAYIVPCLWPYCSCSARWSLSSS